MGKKKNDARSSKSEKGKQKVKTQPKKRTRSSITISPPSFPASSHPISTDHPFLHFTHPDHISRFERLKVKPFEPNRCLHWQTLETLGIAGRIRTMIVQSDWAGFFSVEDVTYRELTLEFFTTYNLNKSVN